MLHKKFLIFFFIFVFICISFGFNRDKITENFKSTAMIEYENQPTVNLELSKKNCEMISKQLDRHVESMKKGGQETKGLWGLQGLYQGCTMIYGMPDGNIEGLKEMTGKGEDSL